MEGRGRHTVHSRNRKEPGRAAYYLALGVVLLGALLVAGLLAGGIALRGRCGGGGQRDRDLRSEIIISMNKATRQ